jgi:hypothetical protein
MQKGEAKSLLLTCRPRKIMKACWKVKVGVPTKELVSSMHTFQFWPVLAWVPLWTPSLRAWRELQQQQQQQQQQQELSAKKRVQQCCWLHIMQLHDVRLAK